MEKLLKQLDKWIKQCDLQVKVFQEERMVTSELSSKAMCQAYQNVKSLIIESQRKEAIKLAKQKLTDK